MAKLSKAQKLSGFVGQPEERTHRKSITVCGRVTTDDCEVTEVTVWVDVEHREGQIQCNNTTAKDSRRWTEIRDFAADDRHTLHYT